MATELEQWLRRSQEVFAELWDDRISRLYLVVGVVAFWLTVSLVEPAFLALFFGAAAGIWMRRDARAAAADAVDEEWL